VTQKYWFIYIYCLCFATRGGD